MCGISGIFKFNSETINPVLFENINNSLTHRGPDSGNIEILRSKIALGHRRLSIIDLTSVANQPMFTDDGRYCIVYNGEVYNFQELKNELIFSGANFKSNSDTEVILKAFQLWSNSIFEKLNGMFAFAIYDQLGDILTLCRDPFGIKPLYYYYDDSLFLFGSEIKAILSYPGLKLSLNNQALSEYMWYGNPLGNKTFYNEIHEIPAGAYAEVKHKSLAITKYFNINDIKEIKISESEAIDKLRSLLELSIKRHLISDVPVGIFLSGGIDSSCITAFASKYYNGKIKTFSCGFDFTKVENELPKAAMLAKIYGTDHHELHITGQNTIDAIEKLCLAHDEPFGDAANIPLYLLTNQIKGEVKVILQGDGGDEFFGGYSRYRTLYYHNVYKYLKILKPLFASISHTNYLFNRIKRIIYAISENDPAMKIALLLTTETKYTNPLAVFNKDFNRQISSNNPFDHYKEILSQGNPNHDLLQKLFFTDTQIILKDTYFEKVDRSTMANSIEVRVPFIDKNLAKFALSLPSNLKLKNGQQKYLLKQALLPHIPESVLFGKKTGFQVPFAYWIATELETYFHDQVFNKKTEEYIDTNYVEQLIKLNKSGKYNYGFTLWKLLIFAKWLNSEQNQRLN